ncbi:MAG: hypothetical protein F6K28_59045 [Microcoleus sp. SIO2G3]|nr:hypothetical protein [Microcoleus sp. SIO2G3]
MPFTSSTTHDDNLYPTGIQVTDEEFNAIALKVGMERDRKHSHRPIAQNT